MKHLGFPLIITAALSLAAVLASCAPGIPHSVEARKDCITCHGAGGTRPYPGWHAKDGFKNEECSNCHHQEHESRDSIAVR